ncbi:MAG: ABC transporter permease [Deinococcales bacterium]
MMLRPIARFFYQHPNLSLALLLAIPLLWLGIIYFASLFALLLQSFFRLDDFTGQVIREFSLSSYKQLFHPANLDIILRTVLMALAVSLMCAFLAFPLAYKMAKSQFWLKSLLYLLVLMPLWSSYVVRVYSWKLILAKEGVISYTVKLLHLEWLLKWVLSLPLIGGPSLSVSLLGTFIVFVYIWLPYMVLPIAAAIERIPQSLIEASQDLGGHGGQTFWKIIFPLALPGVVAGSIFTFSLTLGDFIIPGIIGNSQFFLGQVVLLQQGTAGNIPLAAAFSVVPMLIMAIYLTLAQRMGAFRAL